MSRPPSPVLSPDEVRRLLAVEPTTRLLDVRTPGEFEAEHIAGAYNVPLDTLAEHAAEIALVTNEPLVLVCRSGQRARKAEDALRSSGMANLHVLDGGMAAWAAAQHPVRRGKPRMSLERQVRIAAGGVAASGALLALLVHPLFAIVPAVMGSGLVFAGLTDSCMLGMLLARMPHNRAATCDVGAMVQALTESSRRSASAPDCSARSC